MDDVAEGVAAVKRDLISELPKMRRACRDRCQRPRGLGEQPDAGFGAALRGGVNAGGVPGGGQDLLPWCLRACRTWASAKHAGPLQISFKQPNPQPDVEVIAALARHRGSLCLPAYFVREDTIEALLSHVGGLELVGWRVPENDSRTALQKAPTISPDLFSRLARYDGPLRLARDLTDSQLMALEAHVGDLVVDELPKSELVAESLLRKQGRLFVTTGLSPQTASAAKLIASEKMPLGVCTESRLIGPRAVEIAAALVTRKGNLSMPLLRCVSKEAFTIIQSKRDVRLPPRGRIHVIEADGSSCFGDCVADKEFLRANESHQPPPNVPFWHSWGSQPSPFRGR